MTKSISLNSFHQKIKKNILLVQSYTEIDSLAFIIRACRLKPYSFIFEKNFDRFFLHRWWFDEFGNSFKIIKNKRIQIIYNDLLLDKNKIACTDPYYGLSLDKIAKMSKLFYLAYGKDDLENQNNFIISFLGIDNYLRTYIYSYGEWHRASSLLIGLNNLKLIYKNLDIKYFLEFKNLENKSLPCSTMKGWLSFMPLSNNLIRLLNKNFDDTFAFLK